MRRCGQLGIPYQEAIASPYFARQDVRPRSFRIQYDDGVKGAMGWKKLKRTIEDRDTTPHSRDELMELLELTFPDIESAEISVREGVAAVRQHLSRERNRRIVIAKRNELLKATGRLACSVCRFDFQQFYGEVGSEFCEVHHLRPLADAIGEVETRLDDLAIVCSNCHRMLHRRSPFLTIEQLKSEIKKGPNQPVRQTTPGSVTPRATE